jgi:hypothetical protein
LKNAKIFECPALVTCRALLQLIDPNRVLFYSEEEGRLEKFRPFALSSEEWLQKVSEKLRGKEEE